ncbi:MAG TPA: hypothetical protein VGN72_13400, partial [Tepidisphaeraceae bacterium]|nr:hypothetical protein [Tepidisphaeraceae bacterium]
RMQGVGSTTAPRLQGIEKDGRVAVIVSRDDISTGLLGPEMDGIIGYEPSSAVNVLWATMLASTAK